jgi:catechol 2,3-dioxygenase-like lactoylglutathione lyase family enzyme
MRWTTLVLGVAAVGLLGCKGARRSPLVEAARLSLHDSEMAHPIPILTVRELRASQGYYRDVLGFKVAWEHGDPPSFGAVTRGDATLFMCQGCQGHPGGWVFIFTRDVDRLYEELRGRNAIIKSPPADMPWGMREMQVADRDGNVIRFASETEH